MDGPFAGEEEDAKPLDVGTSEVVAVVRGAVKLDLGDLQVILDEHGLDRVGEEAQVVCRSVSLSWRCPMAVLQKKTTSFWLSLRS